MVIGSNLLQWIKLQRSCSFEQRVPSQPENYRVQIVSETCKWDDKLCISEMKKMDKYPQPVQSFGQLD